MQRVKRIHWWGPLTIGILILTGCRTYGGSTDDQIASTLAATIQQVEAEARIVEVESQMLAEASMLNSELLPYSKRMKLIASEYTEMMKKQKKLVEEAMSVEDNIVTNWVGKDRYRGLHRALGAVVSERELKQGKRYLLPQDLGEHLGTRIRRRSGEEGRLQIRPHYCNRSWTTTDFHDLLTDIVSEPAE